MLQINLGDIGARIVRGFSIRGRVPLGLDETAVPIARVFDFTDPLFAQNPATFVAYNILAGSTPTFANVSLWNGNKNVTTIIDRIFFNDQSTTAPTTPLLLYLGRNVAQPAATAFLPQLTAILNQDNPVGPSALRIQTVNNQNATAATNVFAGVYTQFGSIFLPQGGFQTMEIGAVLYAGDAFAIDMGPEAATVSRQVMIFGREFTAF